MALSRKTPLKRGKALRAKPITEEQKIQREALRKKDEEFYRDIWKHNRHYCQICDKYLGGELKKIFMDHLIEKSSHPELRHEYGNIAIVCEQCHSNKTFGFPAPRYIELIEEAKKQFGV